MTKKLCSFVSVLFLLAAVNPVYAGGAKSSGSWTGNIGIHSKYVLRGMTNNPEDDSGALQGGFDYTGNNGMYFGYWGSSLDSSDGADANGFENNLYGGYTGKTGSIGWDIGLIQYAYVNVDDSDLTELKVALSFSDFKLQMQYLLTDGVWGNEGDQYWTLNYSRKLPKNFKLDLSLGYYVYEDDDASNADMANGTTTTDGEFRHFIATLSHPIGKSGADMYIQYINGGKDRSEENQEDTMVMGITYGFDL